MLGIDHLAMSNLVASIPRSPSRDLAMPVADDDDDGRDLTHDSASTSGEETWRV